MRNVCWKCQGSGLAPGAVKVKEDHDFDPLERAFEMHAKAEAEKKAAADAAAEVEGEGKVEEKSGEEKGDGDEDAAAAEATPKVATWLSKNRHYKEIVRLKVGNAVLLSEEAGAEAADVPPLELEAAVGEGAEDDKATAEEAHQEHHHHHHHRGKLKVQAAPTVTPRGTVKEDSEGSQQQVEIKVNTDCKLADTPQPCHFPQPPLCPGRHINGTPFSQSVC